MLFRVLLFSLFSSTMLLAQSLPDEMYFSNDGHILYTGGRPTSGLYDQSIVRNFYLNFSQSNYWSLLTSNYSAHTDLPATLIVDGLVLDSVGVRFKGMTSYNTGLSQKKSFNLSMDAFIDGQDLMGYNITNLNNCYQDPSFLREVFYQDQIRMHIPAAKSSFVRLFINGTSWGVYPNVQQLNKDFLKEWFMNNNGTNWRADKPPGSGGGMGGGWGDGTAAINYLGTDTTEYKKYYTLKSTKIQNPWENLVIASHVLDTVSAAYTEEVISQYFDLDRTLWFLGSEILFSDDDSYVYKGKMDYYVYYDKATGRLTPLEYDGNSAMESNFISWSPFYNQSNANYPLLNKLLGIPSIRQRYLAHMRTLISEELDSATALTKLDQFRTFIDTMVQNDPKKLYSYSQFTTEVNDLKNFVINRRNYLNSNLEVNKVPPSISDVNYISGAGSWMSPVANEDVTVIARAASTYGIDHLNLYYATGIYGRFDKVMMYDDGNHNDSASGDGIFGGLLPGQSSGLWVRFYIEAVASDAAHTVSYSPVGAEHNVYIFQVIPSHAASSDIVINEVMASNTTVAADSAGEYDDWIELYNISSLPVDISGYFLTDNSLNLVKWEFPAGTVIAPNGYMIVWADEDGGQGDLHCNFKLSSAGEHLLLLNPNLEIVDEVTFGLQTTDMGYARVPNGTGSFIIQIPTFNGNNDLANSVNELSLTAGISVYPNPASESLKIFLSTSTGARLTIYNSIGVQLLEREAGDRISIDVSDWSNGIYFLRSGNSVKRVVIQH